MTEFVLPNLIVGFAAFFQASVGIGFAMIAVPLLVLIDLAYVPGPSIFAMMFLSGTMVIGAWQEIDGRGLSLLLPGLLIGTIAGAMLLGALPPSWFGLVFGVVILLALLVGQLGITPRRSPTAYATGGFFAGCMGTISGIHGPPLVVLFQRTAHHVARATIAAIFVIACIISLVSLHFEGLFGGTELRTGLALLPGLALGYLLAYRLRDVLSAILARRLMIAIASISAMILIFKSLA